MRIALGVEYDGHGFYGWQKQQGLTTIQGQLESALSIIANEPIHLFCAGRTDAGVHATAQVTHFDTQANRSLKAWVMGTNTHLPPQISVRWAQAVDDQFHARFSAVSRTYHYLIFNNPFKPAILHSRVTWHAYPLDEKRMQAAANYLIGELDFTSFRASECDSKSPMRNVHHITVQRHHEFISVEIQANAFLHHMVRNIMGVLLKIGEGLREPDWALTVLQAKDRRLAAETAPPTGLYLIHVGYSKDYAFPQNSSTILALFS